MNNTVALPRIIRMGAGALADIPSILTSLGCTRPMVVTDGFMRSSGTLSLLQDRLAQAGARFQVFDEVVPDPTTASLQPAIDMMREFAGDCVIGLGGGSSLDTAKAVALLASTGRPMRDFKAPTITDVAPMPIIAIPTTAGSGSEATRFTIITDSTTGEKMLCAGLAFLPAAAIVDYSLTCSMPPRLTADTGVDALVHAVEAYVSRHANLFSDALALAAITTIGRFLRRAYRDGSDAEAREHMMLASTQAGIAFSNSSVPPVHGMSRPLGAHFHLAHGLSNAVLFPTVTEFSLPGAPDRYADCARALGVAQVSASEQSAGGALVEELRALNHDLAVPTPAQLGIEQELWESKLATMAEQALASGSPQNNPVVPTPADISSLYRAVY